MRVLIKMNVREEDRRKPASSSRGLGFATAAVGLGIGAALYYYLSNYSPQNSEGATSSNWTTERANVFKFAENSMDSDSYSTISEGTTSDTSVHDNTIDFPSASIGDSSYTESNNNSSIQNSFSDSDCDSHKTSAESDYSFTSSVNNSMNSASDHNQSEIDDSESDIAESDKEGSDAESNDSEVGMDYTVSENSETGTDYSESDSSESNEEDEDVDVSDMFIENGSNTESLETGYTSSSMQHIGNSDDSDTAMEWDVTNTSIGIPSEERNSSLLHILGGLTSMISPRKAPQEDRLTKLRERAFRERPWTLEECSICFELMLRDQEIMTLSCTHNFHSQCIMPWLQEKQTCPNCRKHAD